MSSNDATKNVHVTVPSSATPSPPKTTGTHVDVKATSAKSKATTAGHNGAPEHKRPKDDDDNWKQLVRNALPWAVGVACILAAGAKMKNQACEHDSVTSKGKRIGKSALEETEDRSKRTWFGLKRRTDEAADEAAGKLQDAKNTSVHKARETRDAVRGTAKDAKSMVKEKANDVKDAARETGWWANEKAHEAADAARDAAVKVEQTVAGAGTSATTHAADAEGRAGGAMKSAGNKLEKAGEDKKKGGCSIM